MHKGAVDPETAQAEMRRMLKVYQDWMKADLPHAALRYAAKIIPETKPLFGLIPGVGKAAEGAARVTFKSMELVIDRLFPMREPDMRMRAVAMVNQARRFFGIRE